MMFRLRTLILCLISPLQMVFVVEGSIYLFDTEDSASVEVYDCLYHELMWYCRRPSEPVRLQRDDEPHLCHHQGVSHSFFSLWQKNVSVSEVFQNWRSSLDKAEEYEYYLKYGRKSNETSSEYLCQCNHSASFGRHCEYLLPVSNDFDRTVSDKFHEKSKKLMYAGDIVCYTTLECNSGLLCLDWRDICDGLQQCMSGHDEENCDKLELNECEDDEYRCENGMCIPEEYFLDGDYDCMDWSDERGRSDDTHCPFQPASFECDDRVCRPSQWPCGDGQCIWSRVPLVSYTHHEPSCMNRRDQFFWCESVLDETLWTLPNGRCADHEIFDEQNITEYCHYLRICTVTSPEAQDCSCWKRDDNCLELFRSKCSSWNEAYYPTGALIAPYMFGYYGDILHDLSKRLWKLNGTIKCRGYQVTLAMQFQNSKADDLRFVESYICRSAQNGSMTFSRGYDPFCSNSSRTFNNHSYNILHSCLHSPQCLSVYRIENGATICSDPTQSTYLSDFIEKSCSNVRRHRFRCSPEQITCFYARELGNSNPKCKNEYDEYSMMTQMVLTRLQCKKDIKADCPFLRRYIEDSWTATLHNSSGEGNSLLKKISFRAYCDTFEDMPSNKDESSTGCRSSWRCLRGQWQCSSGHCIESDWVLDRQWDCPDGSDEENFFAFGIHPFNQNDSSFTEKFTEQYPPRSVWSVCNATMGFPCYPNSVSDRYPNKKHCINLTSAHVSQIDCLSGCDERTVIDHCYRSLVALGHRLQCISWRACSAHSHLFARIYTNSAAQQERSTACDSSGSCSEANEFVCWDDNKKTRRCKGHSACSQGEDEYMCHTKVSSRASSRQEKKLDLRTRAKELQPRHYPPNESTTNFPMTDLLLTDKKLQFEATHTTLDNLISAWCNRGVPIHLYNGSLVCFCPSQYHGEQCQYHTDRITVRLHMDFQYSKYTTASDTSIVNKHLLILLYHDEILSTGEFHLRPTTDIQSLTKKMIYLHYPHAKDRIIQKQRRYFNRSDIVDHHPYSIRIEAYEMKEKIKPRRFAVWQYPIYFDFLPVHRLAKVLRFIDLEKNRFDPCRGQPCGRNQECYQLQNRPSTYICLCKNDFSGPQCSVASALCQQNHCATNALCQPDYRGVINGVEWPYCICPLNHVGQRCSLIPNACIRHSCANNGTCQQRSKPNAFKCECTDEYMGANCSERKRSVRLHLKKNTNREYAGVVIQGFDIDFVTLELRPVHQSVYSILPQTFQYFYGGIQPPALILLKLYLLKSTTLHLLSMQINQTSIDANVAIDEENQCRQASELLPADAGESIDLSENVSIR